MSERTNERTETHACDLISRQKAIDAVNAWLLLKSLNRTMSNAMSLQDVLRQLPSAQPEQHWIPCSERLPEKANFYICTMKDSLVKSVWYSRFHGFEKEDVIAWMPLPEPYAERRTDENNNSI